MPNKPKHKEGLVSNIKHSFSQMKRSLRKEVPVDKETLRNTNMTTLLDCLDKINKLKLKYDNFDPENRAAAQANFEKYKEVQQTTIMHAIQLMQQGKNKQEFDAALQYASSRLEANNKQFIIDNSLTKQTKVEISSPKISDNVGPAESYIDTSYSKPKIDITEVLGKIQYRQDRNAETNVNVEEPENPENQSDLSL